MGLASERFQVQQPKVSHEVLGSYNFVYIIECCHDDIKKI